MRKNVRFKNMTEKKVKFDRMSGNFKIKKMTVKIVKKMLGKIASM